MHCGWFLLSGVRWLFVMSFITIDIEHRSHRRCWSEFQRKIGVMSTCDSTVTASSPGLPLTFSLCLDRHYETLLNQSLCMVNSFGFRCARYRHNMRRMLNPKQEKLSQLQDFKTWLMLIYSWLFTHSWSAEVLTLLTHKNMSLMFLLYSSFVTNLFPKSVHKKKERGCSLLLESKSRPKTKANLITLKSVNPEPDSVLFVRFPFTCKNA